MNGLDNETKFLNIDCQNICSMKSKVEFHYHTLLFRKNRFSTTIDCIPKAGANI